MPKLKMTNEQKRENALRQAMARGKASQGFKHDKQIAEALGMSRPNFSHHQLDGFKRMSTETFFRMVRRLQITDRELCTIAGIPYRPNDP